MKIKQILKYNGKDQMEQTAGNWVKMGFQNNGEAISDSLFMAFKPRLKRLFNI